LNRLLREARREAENAETLLFAGDLAARMSERSGSRSGPPAPMSSSEREGHPKAGEREALAGVLNGSGLWMAAQPIVDVRTGVVHAYEALARFEQAVGGGGPLAWFSLAEDFGQRAALERACLKLALELFAKRPRGAKLSVNVSAPVLLESVTRSLFVGVPGTERDLDGLIIEITEETLIHGELGLADAIEPLRVRGAQLAVDDVGAGYSGLRQITTVRPSYLKLDRSLIMGIDRDNERAALVGALAGYSAQVGTLLVAEGIETHAELEAVRRLGVPLAQGFYLARPGRPWPEIRQSEPAEVAVEQPYSAARGTLQPA
jgi:EAL domain-containing protein (putative c-di-GMP-specific phosphodiesterase class I)